MADFHDTQHQRGAHLIHLARNLCGGDSLGASHLALGHLGCVLEWHIVAKLSTQSLEVLAPLFGGVPDSSPGAPLRERLPDWSRPIRRGLQRIVEERFDRPELGPDDRPRVTRLGRAAQILQVVILNRAVGLLVLAGVGPSHTTCDVGPRLRRRDLLTH